MSPGRRIAWWRLWSVQGSFAPDARQWLGWIVALQGARENDPSASWVDDEPREINTNPHLFGILVGARVGIEEEAEAAGIDARDIARTVTEVLPSTLGAVGDRLVWTGIRPALIAVAAALAPLFGVVVAWAAWGIFLVAQAWFRAWSFDWARRHGAAVAIELRGLPFHRVAKAARMVGAVAVGLVTGPVVSSAIGPEDGRLVVGAAAAVAAGAVIAWRRADPLWTLLAVALVSWWTAGAPGAAG